MIFEVARLADVPRRPGSRPWQLAIGPIAVRPSTATGGPRPRRPRPDGRACFVITDEGLLGTMTAERPEDLPTSAARSVLTGLALGQSTDLPATGYLPTVIEHGPLPEPQRTRTLEDLRALGIEAREVGEHLDAVGLLRTAVTPHVAASLGLPPSLGGGRLPREAIGAGSAESDADAPEAPHATARRERPADPKGIRPTTPEDSAADRDVERDADRLRARSAEATKTLRALFADVDRTLVEQYGVDGAAELFAKLGAPGRRERLERAASAGRRTGPRVPSVLRRSNVNRPQVLHFARAVAAFVRDVGPLQHVLVDEALRVVPKPHQRALRLAVAIDDPERGRGLLLTDEPQRAWELITAGVPVEEMPGHFGARESAWVLGRVPASLLPDDERAVLGEADDWSPDAPLLPAAIGATSRGLQRPGAALLDRMAEILRLARVRWANANEPSASPDGMRLSALQTGW